mgnify:CR=1 FL=1
MPTIASMATIGLVALPGMMTGVILGGAAPGVAIKYQIIIMLAIFLSLLFQLVYSWRNYFMIYSNEDYVELANAKGLDPLGNHGTRTCQYNVGAQTRRTKNSRWHSEDVLEIHPSDAEFRGIRDGDWIKLASRSGETSLRAQITDRVSPGVVYTTFHHPDTQANVITTDFSDWATNCPEYKVTAVQVSPTNGPSDWQEDYAAQAERSRRILPAAE